MAEKLIYREKQRAKPYVMLLNALSEGGRIEYPRLAAGKSSLEAFHFQ